MSTLQTSTRLQGKKIAILATDGFEQSELLSPRDALLNAGADIDIVSVKEGEITGWDEDKWGDKVSVDKLVTNASASDYDALMLPGGLFNPDTLRQDKHAKAFIDGFFGAEKNKPLQLFAMPLGYLPKLINYATVPLHHSQALKVI